MKNPAVNVLLVEDDEVDTEWVQRAFAKSKIDNVITVACNGFDALDILRGEGGHDRLPEPFIILLDIQMPDMNGIEFLRTLRKDAKLKSSVVFVLTTSDDQKDIAAAYGHLVAGYFLKKSLGKEFLALPELIQNYWRMAVLPNTLEVRVQQVKFFS